MSGIGERLEPVAAVRALRADPPGRAASGRRGKTFGAALEQFEQLLGAARIAPPASAPILLFYALTQAGRAILAAHAPQPWEVHGHGLSVRTERNRIGDTAITSAGGGLFQAVAATTGSGTLMGRTTLAQLWGSIPKVHREAGLGLEEAPIFMVGQEPRGGLRRVVRDERARQITARSTDRADLAARYEPPAALAVGGAGVACRACGHLHSRATEVQVAEDMSGLPPLSWTPDVWARLGLSRSGSTPSSTARVESAVCAPLFGSKRDGFFEPWGRPSKGFQPISSGRSLWPSVR